MLFHSLKESTERSYTILRKGIRIVALVHSSYVMKYFSSKKSLLKFLKSISSPSPIHFCEIKVCYFRDYARLSVEGSVALRFYFEKQAKLF